MFSCYLSHGKVNEMNMNIDCPLWIFLNKDGKITNLYT